MASADGLAFVDLPPGSLRARGIAVPGPVRVFAFDRRYREHYPSIRLVSGSFRRGSRPAQRGGRTSARDPAGRFGRSAPPGRTERRAAGQRRGRPRARPAALLQSPLARPRELPLRAAVDRRQPCHVRAHGHAGLASRERAARRHHQEPARRGGRRARRARPAARGPGRRARADARRRSLDRAHRSQRRTTSSTTSRTRSWSRAPTPRSASGCSSSSGCPPSCWRPRSPPTREPCWPPRSGASRPCCACAARTVGHLQACSRYRALARRGRRIGWSGRLPGCSRARAILGSDALRQAAPGALALSAVAALAGGLLVTALALFVPGQPRARPRDRPGAARARALVAARVATPVARCPPAGRRRARRARRPAIGSARSLPTARSSRAAPSRSPPTSCSSRCSPWVGGVLLVDPRPGRDRLRLPVRPRPGSAEPLAACSCAASGDAPGSSAAGMVALGLVIAFGTSLRSFIATYDAAKRADAGFVVGSDLRIAPGARPRTAAYASRLRIGGVTRVTPVVFRPENSLADRCATSGRGRIWPRSIRRPSAGRRGSRTRRLPGWPREPRWRRCERIRARSSSARRPQATSRSRPATACGWCSRSGRHARPLRRSASPACSRASPASRARPTSSSAWPPTGRPRELRLSTSSSRGRATRATRASPGRSPRCAPAPGRAIRSRSRRPRRRSTRTSRA